MTSIKNLAGYINHCTDTAENWTTTNPIVPAGVLCLEINTNSSIRLKIGDGTTTWNSLPYKFDYSIGYATETESGLVIRATNLEALDGIDPAKYITPVALKYVLDNSSIVSTGIVLQPGTIPYKRLNLIHDISQTWYNSTVGIGTNEPVNFVMDNADIVFRMEHRGSATLSITHRVLNSSGIGYLRIIKNGTILDEWSTSSTLNATRTLNISFVPGDIIQIQGRVNTGGITEEISACGLLIQDLN